jgi:hypothetical protein
MKHKIILIILLTYYFTNSSFAIDSDIKLLFSKADCKEMEGFGFDRKGKIIKYGGDNFGSLYHICNWKNYRLTFEIVRAAVSGIPQSIGETIIEKKDGKKGKYQEIDFRSVFIEDSIQPMMKQINASIHESLENDPIKKYIKDINKDYDFEELGFVPNIGKGEYSPFSVVQIYFALDLDRDKVEKANESEVSEMYEGNVDLVRSINISIDLIHEWLK